MRCFLILAANAILSGLAGFAVAEVSTTYGYPPLLYTGAGFAGGCLAGLAVCLSANTAIATVEESGLFAGLPKAVGLIGTLAVCAAAMTGHLSPAELKSAAGGFWVVGMAIQSLALILALYERRSKSLSYRRK
jgi:hypothetical protein